MLTNWQELARLRSQDEAHMFGNGGWKYDAYPNLQSLDAGARMTVAELEGPAVITALHTTQHLLPPDPTGPSNETLRALVSRGVILEIYFNGAEHPAVQVPLADFFADGCGGRAQYYSTPFVEKSPDAYNAFIPMPFERSARVVLRNETAHDLANYSYVEAHRLPEWNPDWGYFHAAWKRFAFCLSRDADIPFFHIDGRGHLLGRAWSIATDEPFFRDFHFVMEGNNEVRIDGADEPQIDYLGSEDSFGFAWGWQRPCIGLRNGINYVHPQEPTLLSVYRFRTGDIIPFNKSLDWRIDWTHEFPGNAKFDAVLESRVKAGGCWIDYATTFYWYGEAPDHPHQPLPSLNERTSTLLHPNPPPE